MLHVTFESYRAVRVSIFSYSFIFFRVLNCVLKKCSSSETRIAWSRRPGVEASWEGKCFHVGLLEAVLSLRFLPLFFSPTFFFLEAYSIKRLGEARADSRESAGGRTQATLGTPSRPLSLSLSLSLSVSFSLSLSLVLFLSHLLFRAGSVLCTRLLLIIWSY